MHFLSVLSVSDLTGSNLLLLVTTIASLLCQIAKYSFNYISYCSYSSYYLSHPAWLPQLSCRPEDFQHKFGSSNRKPQLENFRITLGSGVATVSRGTEMKGAGF